MIIMYEMASGRTESLPAENIIANTPYEPIPALAVRELTSDGTDRPLAEFSIHLVHALLRKE